MRTFLIILLSFMLVPVMLVTSALGIVNVVLTESFVISTIEEVDLFGHLEELLPELIEESIDDEPAETEEEEEINPMEVLIPRLELSPILQPVTDSLVGQLFDYLNGKIETVEFTLDLSPIVRQTEDMIMDRDTFIEIMLEVEPENTDELLQLSDKEIAEAQQEALEGFREEVASGDIFPEEIHVDFIEMLSEDDPDFLDTLDDIKFTFNHKSTALWIGIGACLLIIALMLLLKLTGGMNATGICLLLVGGPMAFGAISAQLAMNFIIDVIADEVPVDMIGVVEGLLRQFLSPPRNIGLAYTVGAIVLFTLSGIISCRRKRSQVNTEQEEIIQAEEPEPPEQEQTDSQLAKEPIDTEKEAESNK